MRITLFGKLLSVWPKFTFKCRKFDKCGKWCMIVGYFNRVWLFDIKEIKKCYNGNKTSCGADFQGGGGCSRISWVTLTHEFTPPQTFNKAW